jgi:HEPN domain-containing protein
MTDRKQALLLLTLARNDLRAAGGMSEAEIFSDEIFGFHVQQAAEKSLKAWLALLGVQYPKTHELAVLFQLLRDPGQDAFACDGMIEYSSFAVQFRYELHGSGDTPVDRQGSVLSANELLSHVELVAEKQS